MKTSARFLAMLLAVVMIAGAALSATAFDDVAGNKHANAVNVLAQLGVIGGYEDGTFKPDQKVTRAEMAKLVYVLYTTFVDAGTADTAFADVADDHWATGYINWCSKMGIIGGYGDGKFGPNDNVTYDQALKMVCGVLGYTDFQSNLWPTDVRMTALRTLELGTELEDVKGDAQLTRAQVAQIMYNALNADMNETKTVQVPLGDTGYTVPVEVAKTLAVDIWKFEEAPYTVTGTENYGVNKTGEEDVISLDGKEYELAELGLEKYEGKTDALIGLEVVTLVDNVKKEMLAAATVSGTVVDGVEVTYNKNKDTLTVNGVKFTAEKKAEDELKIWDLAKNDFAGDIFTETKTGATESTLIDSDIIAALDKAYMARAIDVEGDGEVDAIIIAPKTAYTVKSLNKDTNKTVSMTELDGTGTIKPASADLTVAVEKDDIVVIAEIGGIYYAEIVEAVETYATKLNAAGGKVTLAEVGEVAYKDLTVAGVTAQSITTAQLGSANKTGYYVYNGELLLADDIKTTSDYSIAILQEVVKSDDNEVNKETMEFETYYKATLLVDGKEMEVTLASDEAIYNGEKFLTAVEAFDTYKKTSTAGGKVNYKYALVAAYEEEDGVYTLTLNTALNPETDVVVAGGTLSYNATTGLYTVKNDSKTYTKVALDENSKIFYTYEKTATGDFQHIANYTEETITSKKFTANVIGETYLVTADEGKTYTLLATIVKGEIKGSADDVIDHTNDGTLILYAPVDAVAYYDEVAEENYYEYTFMDNETITNKEAFVDKTKTADDDKDPATQTVSGKFYAWDNELDEYVEIEAKADTESFKAITIDDVVYVNNAYYIEIGSELIKLNDDVTIWGLDATEEETNDTYLTFTAAELADMLTLVNEYNADNADVEGFTALTVNAILVQVEDANDDFQLNTVIVEVFEADEEDDDAVKSINNTIFKK